MTHNKFKAKITNGSWLIHVRSEDWLFVWNATAVLIGDRIHTIALYFKIKDHCILTTHIQYTGIDFYGDLFVIRRNHGLTDWAIDNLASKGLL